MITWMWSERVQSAEDEFFSELLKADVQAEEKGFAGRNVWLH